ncbi:divergent PAP2 family protein [Patescibacteria group bacterium]|nr:divergent PAP2 family protein [Patescibacteria group bacterium]
MFYILGISLFAGVLSQFIKFVIKFSQKRSLSWHSLDAYGGMPSSHAAFLLSLLTAVGLVEGFTSTSFAIAFIIAAIIIRDAFGLRMILEEQGKLLVKIIDSLPKKDKEKQGLVIEKEKAVNNHLIGHRIGHTIPEIIVGSIIGVLTALAGYAFYI